MKKLLSLISVAIVAGVIAGCGSEATQTINNAPNAAPPKNSFPSAIKDNPNIPDAAKNAMIGNHGAPK